MVTNDALGDVERSLQASRTVHVALGVLMHHERIDAAQARALMQQVADRRRTSIEVVARAIVDSAALGFRITPTNEL
jgi:AmiR/NasT family two-component response regulator